MNKFPRLRIWLGVTVLFTILAGCTVPTFTQFTPTTLPISPLPTSVTNTVAPTGLPNSQPGLLIKGYVHLVNGDGLAGVKIYRAFAAYSGEIIATTKDDGSYQSEFIPIPGDEMVRVWAELPGYQLEPDQLFGADPSSTTSNTVYWRHYYGYEMVVINFQAIETH